MKQYDAQEVIDRIAMVAAVVGAGGGVGGMEIAGGILSYLAEHPRDLEPFMNGGILEIPPDFWMHGKLAWQGGDGKVYTPEHARRAVIVSKLKKGAAA